MWTIPPIIGQKVMLNPGHEKYEMMNERQAKGDDGVITEVNTTFDWMLGSAVKRNGTTVRVAWLNGHTNSYRLDHLLPLSGSFYNLKRYSFKNEGIFFAILNERDNLTAERYIIDEGFKFEISMFDKDMRIKILNKHLAKYDDSISTIRTRDEDQAKVMDEIYASIVEEMTYTERASAVDWLEEATKRYPKPMKTQPTSRFDGCNLGEWDNSRRNLGAGLVGLRDMPVIDEDFTVITEAVRTFGEAEQRYRSISEVFHAQNAGQDLTISEQERLRNYLWHTNNTPPPTTVMETLRQTERRSVELQIDELRRILDTRNED